jgi:hypothetical protein
MGRRRDKEARKGARACSAGEFGYMSKKTQKNIQFKTVLYQFSGRATANSRRKQIKTRLGWVFAFRKKQLLYIFDF